MIDLAGQKFGKYVVLSDFYRTPSSTYWLCECVCGEKNYVKSTHLRRTEATGCRSCRGREQSVRMSGKRFGDYLVLDKSQRRQGHTYWYCTCVGCHKKHWVEGHNLRSGKSTRCRGCGLRGKNIKDLAGTMSNQLTVVKSVGTKFGMSLWQVRCVCGKEKVLPAEQIGSTKSCGCLRRRKAQSHPNFKHEKSLEERLLSKNRAMLPNYRTWVHAVKAAFKNKCAACGSTIRIVAHHLESFIHSPNLRTELTNGACLCSKHHKAFHDLYGNGQGVTASNFYAWLNAGAP